MSVPNEIKEIQQFETPYDFKNYRLDNIGNVYYQHNTWMEDYRLYRGNLPVMVDAVTCQIDINENTEQQIDYLVSLCILRDLFKFKLGNPKLIYENEQTLIKRLKSLTEHSILSKDILLITDYKQLIKDDYFLSINVGAEEADSIKNTIYNLIHPIRQLSFNGVEDDVLIDKESFEARIIFVISFQVWLDLITAIIYKLKTQEFFPDEDVQLLIGYMNRYFGTNDLIGEVIIPMYNYYTPSFNIYVELNKRLKNINSEYEELMLQLFVLANKIYLPPIRNSMYTIDDLKQIIVLQTDLVNTTRFYKEEFKTNKYFISPANSTGTCLLNGMFNKMLLMMFGDHLWPFDENDPIETRFKLVDDYPAITPEITNKIHRIYIEWQIKFLECGYYIDNKLTEIANMVLNGTKINTETIVKKFITNTDIFEPLSYLIGAIIGNDKIPLTYVYIPLYISFAQLISDLSNLYYFEFCNGFEKTGHPNAMINGECTYGKTDMLLMDFENKSIQTLEDLIFTKHGEYDLLEIVSNLITIHLKNHVFTKELMYIEPYQDIDINENKDESVDNALKFMDPQKISPVTAHDVLSGYINFLVEHLPSYVKKGVPHYLLMCKKSLIRKYIIEMLKFIDIDIDKSDLSTDEFVVKRDKISQIVREKIYSIIGKHKTDEKIKAKINKTYLNKFEFQYTPDTIIKDENNWDLLAAIILVWNNKSGEFYNFFLCERLQINYREPYFYALATTLATHMPLEKQFTKKICQFSVSGLSEDGAHTANVLMFFSPRNGICILYIDDGYLTSRDWAHYIENSKCYIKNPECPTEKEQRFKNKFDIFYEFGYNYGLNITDYNFKRGYSDEYISSNPGLHVIHIKPESLFDVYKFTERNRIGFKEPPTPQEPQEPPQQKGGLLSSFFKKLCIVILVFIIVLCVVIYVHDHYWFRQQYTKKRLDQKA